MIALFKLYYRLLLLYYKQQLIFNFKTCYLMKMHLLLSTSIIFCCVAIQANAQGPAGDIAPNIVLTDIDGVSHNMYDDLDAGKTVYLDFFATWCGPCISSIPSLDDIWDDHGPNGDNSATIFSLEMDASTSNEGSFQNQYNISNPIFNNGHTIAGQWNISAYPTFIKVCPNRTFSVFVGGLGSNNSAALTGLPVLGCLGPATMDHDAANLWYEGPTAICPGETTSLGVKVQNHGMMDLTSATVEVFENGSSVGSKTWTGNRSPYQLVTISVTNVTINDPSNIELKITTPDDDLSNNDRAETLGASAPGSTTHLEIQTDNYGSETSWELYDSNNNIVGSVSAGTYQNQIGGGNFTYDWNLNDQECYRFEIHDDYNDGMCCGFGQGYYKLTGSNGMIVAEGAQFNDDDIRSFTVDFVSSIGENELENTLSIYPNPTNDQATISFTLSDGQDVSVEIFNVVGAVVMNKNLNKVQAGNHLEVLDFSNMNAGLYYIKIVAGNMTTTKKLTVNK